MMVVTSQGMLADWSCLNQQGYLERPLFYFTQIALENVGKLCELKVEPQTIAESNEAFVFFMATFLFGFARTTYFPT